MTGVRKSSNQRIIVNAILLEVRYEEINVLLCVWMCRFQRDSTELEEWMRHAQEQLQKWNSFSDSGHLDSRTVCTQLMVIMIRLIFYFYFIVT